MGGGETQCMHSIKDICLKEYKMKDSKNENNFDTNLAIIKSVVSDAIGIIHDL